MTSKEAMQLAIEEAKKGAGFVSPNPLVGCVILSRSGDLLAKGYHARVGENHAEVNALNQITDPQQLEGAQVFVTLEPCAHEGRTPSCAKRLAQLPVASVIYGVQDPNPLVSGQGAAILRQAGISVAVFTEGLESELEALAEIFFLNMREKRPFVAVKVASSLDGKVALHDGSSQWITGEESRAHVQYLRGCYDAVVTGVGTFARDNPRLNSRDERFKDKSQKLVLLDPTGRSFKTLEQSALLSVRSAQDLIVVTAPMGTRAPVGRHIEIPDAQGAFDTTALFAALTAEGIHSLFVEAGPYTVSQFLKARLVDRLYVFLAPKILGDGLSWTTGLSLPGLDHAIQLADSQVQSFGGDILITGRPQARFP